MSYTQVKIIEHMNEQLTKVNEAKKNGGYAGREANWDKAIMALLTSDVELAEKQRKQHADYVKERREAAQKLIQEIETRLKQKTLGADEVKLIQTSAKSILRIGNEVHQDSVNLMEALKFYRENYNMIAREALSNEELLKSLDGIRVQGIADDKTAHAHRARCQEYATRVAEYVKQAAQRAQNGKLEQNEFNQEVLEIVDKMNKGKLAVEEFKRKADNFKTHFDNLDKAKSYTAEDKKFAAQWLADVAGRAKQGRGTLKTLEIELQGFEKRCKSAGSNWLAGAKNQIDSARKVYGQAFSIVKSVNDFEAVCKRIHDKVRK